MGNHTSICRRMDTGNHLYNIETVRVEYKCPIYHRKDKANLMYIPHMRNKKHPPTISAFRYNFCNAKAKINYRIFKRRNGTFKLKIFYFNV